MASAVLFLGALGPGMAFSYVGLPGFGTFFFVAFILGPNLILAGLSLGGVALVARGRES